jgi:Lon protease-like protein
MAEFDLSFDPSSFSGVVRIFPLPNLVLFPHVIQPLHIFEPRYKAMMEEALASDQLIAMALLAPGWEENYDGRPRLHSVACLGRVATHQRLPDGRFNLLLLGMRRVRLLRELPPAKLFREAEVELLDDHYPVAGEACRAQLQARLVAAFKGQLASAPQIEEHLEQLLAADVSLGMLTDLVSHAAPLEPELKLSLLAETNVDERAKRLLAVMASHSLTGPHLVAAPPSAGAKYPPDFSRN